ncbi:MAG: hypothetical protein IPK75_17720 [Acidobacteria bacterium]|nr:hypothetical protein [Acidobacteriota bacterium]
MKAAYLYDWREKNMLISGNELAMLFAEVLGDPSPAGKTPIDLVYEAGSSSRRLHESGQAFVARERANRIAFEARVREALAKHGLEW